jgi:hypothetical protein
MSLTREQYAVAKGLPLDFLAEIGITQTERGEPAIVIPYRDEEGRTIATRYRYALNGESFRWRKGTSLSLYGRERKATARQAGYAVLCEGESDCHTLWFHGVPAFGVPGAHNWKEDRDVQHFDGIATIYLIVEPDMGGERLLAKLANSAVRDRVRLVRFAAPLKDPSALYLDNREAFPERFAAMLRKAETCVVSSGVGTAMGENGPGEAERAAIAKLGEGDVAGFLARAKVDPGFPFEPDAIDALNNLASSRAADFERLRARLKADTRARLAMLDAAMAAESAAAGAPDGLPGRAIRFEEIELWPERVNGSELLTELSDAIGAYVIMDKHQRDAVTLGAVFAHTHDLRDFAPIFFLVSPTKRCGKTRVLRLVRRLVPRPLLSSNVTAAFMARVIEKHRPTVLIDEYDATARGDPVMAESLRGQLNSSFDRDGAKIGKCVPFPGSGFDEREFSTWAPTWIAGIKHVPDTVADHSIQIGMKRKLPGEKVSRLRGTDGGEFDVLKRQIARWVADNEQRLREIEPQPPEELDAAGDRAADAWDPLFAVADVAGGDWPKRVRAAALMLCGVEQADASDENDIEATLLADLKRIFEACDAFAPTGEQLKSNKQIAAEALEALERVEDGHRQPRQPRHVVGLGGEQITNALATLVERKWPTWDKGKPMRPHQLSKLLSAYRVRSQTLRDGAWVFRGYARDALDDAFERYLLRSASRTDVPKRYSVATPEEQGETNDFESVTGIECNASDSAGNSCNSGLGDGVTLQKRGERGPAGKGAERASDENAYPDVHGASDPPLGIIRDGLL